MDIVQGRSGATLLIAVSVLMLLANSAWAATYIVGDKQGWKLNVNYTSWAATKTFRAGDVLIFTYTQLHSVVEVSAADFASCTINPINTYLSGNDSVTLSSTKSTQFFICGTGGHCGSGMALQVKISPAAASTPAPAPTPRSKPPARSPKSPASASAPASVPPPSSTTPSPAGSTDQTSPPPAAPRGNSAVTLAAAGAGWLSLAVAALAY